MRVLLWHGYLLTGSGSNVYTANLAREWKAAGHDVIVQCQDRNASALPFVDEAFDQTDNRFPDVQRRPGTCRVARPDIGGLLPVYVYDDYEGFVVKRFVDLSDAELMDYTDRNVAAMIAAIEAHEPDAIVTGHEVMGPFIAKQACAATGSGYTAKLHGSALEYAVKVQRRYRDYAIDGLTSARRVVGGSRYMVREAESVVPGWTERATVINPGCDTDLFAPLDVPRSGPPVIGYVGKLIEAKGVHDLLAALGLIDAPGARIVIVGYGGFEEGLHDLVPALAEADLDGVRAIASRSEGTYLRHLVTFVEQGYAGGDYIDRFRSKKIVFTGRLEHGPLSELLPTFDLLVVPSVVPEAFGMVAAEAAACAVLPVVPDHSGIAEAGAAVEQAIGRAGLLTFSASDPIHSMAERLRELLDMDRGERSRLGARAAELARTRWSWSTVAEKLLAVATGK